ncbi:MAG: thioredoxin domain-containing protein [Myxococcota bacterium]
MTRFQLSVHLGLACLLLGGCAPEAARDDSPVVATVDGRSITQSELDDWIRDQLFEQQVGSKAAAQQYEVRSSALEGLISERVIEAAAEAEGVEPDALIESKTAELGPVTEEEVAAFFAEHQSRFRPPNNTLESRADQIRRFLENQRPDRVRSEIREAASVEVFLDAPRVQVAATGPSIGPETAPVTIVEFSDYQCPYCSKAEPIVRQLIERYGDQIRFVYRHYPLDRIHPRARAASEAAVCAEEQDRFWAFHEQLFANQRKLEDADLETYAGNVGLDMEAFAACRERPDVKARVQGDVEAAQQAGVSGTPAFFVNGIMLSGARPPDAFAEVIDAELASAAGAEADAS